MIHIFKYAFLVITVLTIVSCKSSKNYRLKVDKNKGGEGIMELYDKGFFYTERQTGMSYEYSFGLFEHKEDTLILKPIRDKHLYSNYLTIEAYDSIKFSVNSNSVSDEIFMRFFNKNGKVIYKDNFNLNTIHSLYIPSADSLVLSVINGEEFGYKLKHAGNRYYSFFLDYYRHFTFYDSDTMRLVKGKKSIRNINNDDVWIRD